MKLPFNTIWELNEKGITNKVGIRVSGITACPNALRDHKGFFGGIDWNLFKDRDLEVHIDKDIFVITGVY